MNNPDLILTADLHLRDDQPVCRTDNFWNVQIKKLKWLNRIQKEYDNIPILCAGDVFEKWKTSPKLLSMAINYLPSKIISVPGNHDLPAHNLKRLKESGYQTLIEAKNLFYVNKEKDLKLLDYDVVIYGFPFDSSLNNAKKKELYTRKIAIIHKHVYKGRKPFPGATGGVSSIIKKLSNFDMILSGDNHISFTYEKNNTLLVNPGSFTRQKADQINHKPRIYLYYAKTNSVEPIYLEIDKHVISREHIDKNKELNKNVQKFVNELNNNFDVELDFEENMKKEIYQNKIDKKVEIKIMEAMNG